NNNIIRLKVPDKEIEIFTWQSEKATKDFDYHCLIKNEDGSLLKFTRENRDYSRIRREEFNKDNWYGAVYYHILPQSFGNQNYYILFGFAQNSSEEKFKIIETISFNTNDLKLGLPVFPYVDKDKESTTLNRMLIKYSQGSNCLLRFEEVEKQIIFDHMIYYEDFGSGTMGSYLPDGSYEAFEYKGKTWKYIPKLKVEVQSTPPRERPVLDGNTKDIFGKDNKK
ncbi:MAG: hypothetical protein HOP11_03360, partial [Saprospiraceae bacterium]|nr:hypothetical protein [Saprospiraceae bacterium]